MIDSKDHISLRGMEFYSYHGVLAEEQTLGQRFIVDLELYLDLARPAKSDFVEDTVNYALVYEEVKRIVEQERMELIETLAQRIADRILGKFLCHMVRVVVHKPQAPIPGIFTDVSVSVERKAELVQVFLSLGSNLGKRGYNLREGLRHLSSHPGIELGAESYIYESEPWGVENQPPYWNMAVEIKTNLSPGELLRVCQDTEKALGRMREEHWGARTLDVDILLYGEQIIVQPELTVPHPYLKERAFVLVPLLEIAPELKLPTGEALHELHGTGKVALV